MGKPIYTIFGLSELSEKDEKIIIDFLEHNFQTNVSLNKDYVAEASDFRAIQKIINERKNKESD